MKKNIKKEIIENKENISEVIQNMEHKRNKWNKDRNEKTKQKNIAL